MSASLAPARLALIAVSAPGRVVSRYDFSASDQIVDRAAWRAAASAPARPAFGRWQEPQRRCLGNLSAMLGQRADRRVSSLRLAGSAGEMLRQLVEVLILQVLDDRRHRLDLAHALAHQEKLVEDEERRLAGERWNFLHLGVAVLAVAGAAELDLLGKRLRPAPARDRRARTGRKRPPARRPAAATILRTCVLTPPCLSVALRVFASP